MTMKAFRGIPTSAPSKKNISLNNKQDSDGRIGKYEGKKRPGIINNLHSMSMTLSRVAQGPLFSADLDNLKAKAQRN